MSFKFYYYTSSDEFNITRLVNYSSNNVAFLITDDGFVEITIVADMLMPNFGTNYYNSAEEFVSSLKKELQNHMECNITWTNMSIVKGQWTVLAGYISIVKVIVSPEKKMRFTEFDFQQIGEALEKVLECD